MTAVVDAKLAIKSKIQALNIGLSEALESANYSLAASIKDEIDRATLELSDLRLSRDLPDAVEVEHQMLQRWATNVDSIRAADKTQATVKGALSAIAVLVHIAIGRGSSMISLGPVIHDRSGHFVEVHFDAGYFFLGNKPKGIAHLYVGSEIRMALAIIKQQITKEKDTICAKDKDEQSRIVEKILALTPSHFQDVCTSEYHKAREEYKSLSDTLLSYQSFLERYFSAIDDFEGLEDDLFDALSDVVMRASLQDALIQAKYAIADADPDWLVIRIWDTSKISTNVSYLVRNALKSACFEEMENINWIDTTVDGQIKKRRI